jgi:hypothetical protein
LRGVPECLDQLVGAIVLGIYSAALDPEVIGKILGDEVRGFVNGLERIRAEGDGLERTLFAVEQ